MKVIEVVVQSFADKTKTGKIYATRTLGTGEDAIVEDYEVFYTSPWGTPGVKSTKEIPGMYALPGPGQVILIVQPEDSNYWYFLSVVHSGPSLPNDTNVPKDMYKKRPAPEKFIIRDPKGNELSFSYGYKKNFDFKVLLKSSLGKRLVLNDSPKINHVSLTNEKGDGIKIRGRNTGPFVSFPPPPASRSIEIQSKGPLNLQSRESGINMTVADGKDITLQNSSTGLNALYADLLTDQTSILGQKLPFLIVPYGNINLTSDWRDVNITAGKTHGALQKILPAAVYQIPDISEHYRGKVMITSKGGVTTAAAQGSIIQLHSDGSVIIKAPKGKVYIQGDTVNVRGDSELNLESRGFVNINAGVNITMTAGTAPLYPADVIGTRPGPGAPEAAIQAYENSLALATLAPAPGVPGLPGSVASPPLAITQIRMIPGNLTLESATIANLERVPRTGLAFGSGASVDNFLTARQAETAPYIVNDYEKGITPI